MTAGMTAGMTPATTPVAAGERMVAESVPRRLKAGEMAIPNQVGTRYPLYGAVAPTIRDASVMPVPPRAHKNVPTVATAATVAGIADATPAEPG